MTDLWAYPSKTTCRLKVTRLRLMSRCEVGRGLISRWTWAAEQVSVSRTTRQEAAVCCQLVAPGAEQGPLSLKVPAWAGGGDENKTGHLYPGIQCHFLILHRSRRCVGHLEWPVNYSSFYGVTSPDLSWSSSQVSLYGSRSGGKVDIQYFVECHCLEELPRFSRRPTAFVTREGSGMSRLLEGNKKYSATGNACLRLAGFVKWASADKKHFSLTARISMELDPRSEKANCVSPPCRLACRHFEV